MIAAAGPALRMVTLAPERRGRARRGREVRRGGRGRRRRPLARHARAASRRDRARALVRHARRQRERLAEPAVRRAGGLPAQRAERGRRVPGRATPARQRDPRRPPPAPRARARAASSCAAPDAVALVSDATPATGLPPGRYRMGGLDAEIRRRGLRDDRRIARRQRGHAARLRARGGPAGRNPARDGGPHGQRHARRGARAIGARRAVSTRARTRICSCSDPSLELDAVYHRGRSSGAPLQADRVGDAGGSHVQTHPQHVRRSRTRRRRRHGSGAARSAVGYEDSLDDCAYPKFFDAVVMRPISFARWSSARRPGRVHGHDLAPAIVNTDYPEFAYMMVVPAAKFTFARPLGQCVAVSSGY